VCNRSSSWEAGAGDPHSVMLALFGEHQWRCSKDHQVSVPHSVSKTKFMAVEILFFLKPSTVGSAHSLTLLNPP
jgi:hypothetical protein